jgi:hypothetical protein
MAYNGSDDAYVMGDGKVVGETDKAIRVLLTDADAPQWVPKSVVHDDSEIWKTNDVGSLVVKKWWYEKNHG